MVIDDTTEIGRRVEPMGRIPPAAQASEPSGMDALPTQYLADASRRLGILVLLQTLAYAAAAGPQLVRGFLRLFSRPSGAGLHLDDVLILLWLALCLGFFFAIRTRRVSARRSIELGLMFEVVAAFMIMAPRSGHHRS